MAEPPSAMTRSSHEYLVERSTTREVPPSQRAEYWTELVSGFHCRMRFEFAQRGNFDGTTVRQRTRNYQLVGWRSDEDTIGRTAHGIRTDPDDDYRLIFPVRGTMALRHAGVETGLRPGRAGLAPMSVPLQIWQGGGTEAFVLTAPRCEFDRRLPDGAPRVTALDVSSGLGRLVGDLAVGLFEERDALDRRQFDAVSDRLVELVCLMLLGEDRPGNETLADLERTLRRYAREHAGDRELNPHTMARAVGWSLRQIQLALKQSGITPTALIREERLLLARDRLRGLPHERESITDIALQLGFSSTGAFSTAFRERFGMRPRDIR
ncbi:helix-turn-helix domain-containing protein [Pseudonocardia endophytica]|uniref:AraC-like DNA-binding protein n=1 Tax=Pseudonocardia endophytica TaxID=401976 RepID=A0A4R1HK63_PSEEN|nr:helix-turn-helix domain-containing protein [Pseudonocardia endophytica]TCK19949.1 AraC-like DNA-binding protein [Pseudonocardia endophytica]